MVSVSIVSEFGNLEAVGAEAALTDSIRSFALKSLDVHPGVCPGKALRELQGASGYWLVIVDTDW